MRGSSSVFIRKIAHVPLLKLRSLALAVFYFVLLDGLLGGLTVDVLGLFFFFCVVFVSLFACLGCFVVCVWLFFVCGFFV